MQSIHHIVMIKLEYYNISRSMTFLLVKFIIIFEFVCYCSWWRTNHQKEIQKTLTKASLGFWTDMHHFGWNWSSAKKTTKNFRPNLICISLATLTGCIWSHNWSLYLLVSTRFIRNFQSRLKLDSFVSPIINLTENGTK